MAWFYIILAGFLEIVWATGMKYSQGFTQLIPSLWTVAAMAASFYFLSLGLRQIPIGTAYAVWTGIGAVGVAAYGMIFFGESKDGLRLLSLFLVIVGILGLKLGTSSR
jgi:quaternary ammonium compound-resistance protein SugE